MKPAELLKAAKSARQLAEDLAPVEGFYLHHNPHMGDELQQTIEALLELETGLLELATEVLGEQIPS